MLNDLYRSHGTGRDEALRLVTKEIKAGRLAPAKEFCCVDCGKPAQVYEHRDYNKPLAIEPTCRSCNTKRGPAIPKTMTFSEFVASVRKRFPFAKEGQFEIIRRKYWPNEQQQGEQK
jgi:hypothetical protein